MTDKEPWVFRPPLLTVEEFKKAWIEALPRMQKQRDEYMKEEIESYKELFK